MANKLFYVPSDDTLNYPFCKLKLVVERLDTQLNETTNQNSPKLFSQRVRKLYYETLGTSIINSLMSPPSVIYMYLELGIFTFGLKITR